MSLKTLNAQQRAFVSKYLSKGLFSGKQNDKTVAAYETYVVAEQRFKAATLAIPPDHPEVKQLVTEARPALDAKQAGDFATAEALMGGLAGRAEALQLELGGRRDTLLQRVDGLVVPPHADGEAVVALSGQRDLARQALAKAIPSASQLTAAGNAIQAFGDRLGVLQVAVAERRRALAEALGQLVVPDYAAGAKPLADALATARDALAPPLPTPAQLASAAQLVDGFAELLEAERLRVAERRRVLGEAAALLAVPAFAAPAAVQALGAQKTAATEALAPATPTPGQLAAAEQAIAKFAELAEAERLRVAERRNALRLELGKLGDPSGALGPDKLAMRPPREAATLALSTETPTPADIAKAEAAIATLRRLVPQAAKLAGLAARDPVAATAARDTLKAMRAKIGAVEVTPERLDEARQAVLEKQAAVARKLQEWRDANALPDGTTPQERQAKADAIRRTAEAWSLENDALAAARVQENAMLGESLLTRALTLGPLSADTGRPFKPASAKAFIEAYALDPKLADTAVTTAQSAKYPEAIAGNLASLANMKQGKFARTDGTAWTDPADAENYANNLLKVGGNAGPEFFARLPAYVQSGRQFEAFDAMQGAGTYPELAQKRSATLAAALVKPDGSLDLASDGAKNAIGDLLMHPNAVALPTPALTEHVLKTVKFLGDPVTGPQASNVLKAVPKPTDGGAQTLVRKALGKADGAEVEAGDARTAVLAAMLKPMDQGPVGSCFSTGPIRRVCETDPLRAMKAYAEIAGNGTCTPANGVPAKVVTNIPPGEDPIQRSWEYSLATAAVRDGAKWVRNGLTDAVKGGVDQLRGVAASTDNDTQWGLKKAKLIQDVTAGFSFIYDPLSKVTDANDGSSSQGRYVIQRVASGKQVVTRDDFVTEMAEVAIASLGILPTAPMATAVRDLVKSDGFVNAVCPGNYKPWALPSGGIAGETIGALTGGTGATTRMLSGASKTAPPPEGERTKAVLQGFLNTLGSSGETMVTIDTVGMHTFNALPNHPSLAPLKGANPTETAQKINTNLIAKGLALKDTELSASRAAALFEAEMQAIIGNEKDPTLKGLLETAARDRRPATALKPAALATLVRDATAEYHERAAAAAANAWKTKQEDEWKKTPGTASKTVSDQELRDKADKLKSGKVEAWANRAKGNLARDMGAPEFVIADTNWGDCRNHTSFVIAPDPTTGEPLLWQKVEPPGTLTPAGREWVDAAWARY